MTPESASSLFPDRPIRPLPKRRLKERLLPEEADAIKYPRAPQDEPLFYYPYNLKDDLAAGTDASLLANRENASGMAQDAALRKSRRGGEHEGGGLMFQARRALVSRPPHDSGHSNRSLQRPGQARYHHPQPPPSTASSADGYDSFENTNNKKKRKIPSAGEGSLHGVHALHESGTLGLPSPPTTGDEGSGDPPGSISTYYPSGGTVTNGQNFSGPGRGRFGRARNGKSPLRALPESNSAYTAGRAGKLRPGGHYPVPSTAENSGIISNAIASAERLTPSQGQDNISLLHQEASTKANPASSQFTFTFDSQMPGSVSWPGPPSGPPHIGHMGPVQSKRVHPSARQDGLDAFYGSAPIFGQVPVSAPGGGVNTLAPSAPQKKPKRRSNSLLRQAKQRRQNTETYNYQHPPAPEDIWICEFCEYERIFGRPPEALIRQYETKERDRRRKERECRKLQEKMGKARAKKSKKGKKGKNSARNSAPAQDRNNTPPVGQHAPNQEFQSDEFNEDDYYDEDINDEGSCAAASGQAFPTSVPGQVDGVGNEDPGGGGDGITGRSHLPS